jgi:hypothetical protein
MLLSCSVEVAARAGSIARKGPRPVVFAAQTHVQAARAAVDQKVPTEGGEEKRCSLLERQTARQLSASRAIRAPGLPARDGCLGLQQEFCRPAASLRAESHGEEVLQLVAIIFRLAGST